MTNASTAPSASMLSGGAERNRGQHTPGTKPKPGELLLPIPMIGGGMASLSVQIPMSDKNFHYLKTMIVSMLDGMKEALIVREVTIKDLASNADLVTIGPESSSGKYRAIE